jgi:hypothetical protein
LKKTAEQTSAGTFARIFDRGRRAYSIALFWSDDQQEFTTKGSLQQAAVLSAVFKGCPDDDPGWRHQKLVAL